MSDDPYLIPGTGTLRNKFGITDPDELDDAERVLVRERLMEGRVPTGAFDLAHLQAIHRYLFQDVYDWAGEVRTVEMSKEKSVFQLRAYIGTGMADIHRRLVESDFLRGLTRRKFAAEAARIIGDVNYVHPFREGNGRTQALYLEQLAEKAGHPIDLGKLTRETWIPASQAAINAEYAPMARCIERALIR